MLPVLLGTACALTTMCFPPSLAHVQATRLSHKIVNEMNTLLYTLHTSWSSRSEIASKLALVEADELIKSIDTLYEKVMPLFMFCEYEWWFIAMFKWYDTMAYGHDFDVMKKQVIGMRPLLHHVRPLYKSI